MHHWTVRFFFRSRSLYFDKFPIFFWRKEAKHVRLLLQYFVEQGDEKREKLSGNSEKL